MTNTYNTLNPLGSTSAKDLSDNASNFDEGMNSLSPSFYDRFKRRRETWAGMEKMVNDFLEAMGFEATHLTYVDGTPLTVLRPTQLIDRAGSVYKVKMPAVFPVMLTGTWATDQSLLVDVGDSALRASLASSSGAKIVGWDRAVLTGSADTVDTMLSAQAVNIWEYSSYVVSKPTPLDPSTWDWTPAIQAACDFCNATFPTRPLGISTMCRITAPIVINRPVDGASVRDTFTIFGENGGGIIVDSAIAMFTSTITPAFSGSPPQPECVSQTVRLQGLTLTSTDPALVAYVFDGNKFLRIWVVGCDISKIRFADTSSYQQSIYFIANNIRYWQGMFFRATGGCYDVRFAPGNLVEQGEDFIEMLGQTSDKDVTGCSIDGSCIEGLTGHAIRYSHARGVSVTNNYFEANAGYDIVSNDFPAVTNRGITHSGNLHACSAANKLNAAFYPVVWGKTSGGVSFGNTSDHNLNEVRPDTQVVISDHAAALVTSDSSRSSPGDIMYGSVSPQVNNASYGGRAWKPGSMVINNTGSKTIMGWITPNGTTWYPMGPVDDGEFWRFPDSSGLDHARIATSDGASLETSLWLRYSNGVSQVIGRVTVGAPDSGGTGRRMLSLPN